MKLKKGTEILIKAVVVNQAMDERPENEKGYEVTTSRGGIIYVNPEDILIPLKEKR